MSPRCVAPVGALLGEGPLWFERENAIYFVDIKGQRLHRIALDDESHTSWETSEPMGWLIPRASGEGFIAGFKSGFAELSLAPFTVTQVGAPEPERPTNRLNDAKADSHGRIWAGSMDDEEKQQSGALYRLDPDRTWRRMDDGYGVANGPTFSPHGDVLYHTDSAARLIYRFDLAPDGALSNKRVFVKFESDWGYPDGMTTDAEGGVWVAHWDGARVSRFTPDGKLDRAIRLPVSRPTSCVFAGKDLRRMFVTSARVGRENEPLAGALFEIDPEIPGAPAHTFGG